MTSIRSTYTDSVQFFGPTTPQALVEEFGTPLYVYSEKILRERCRELVSMCKTRGFTVNYSVKANSNPALLSIIREEGLTADAMSPGELHMDLLAGYSAETIFYISNNISPDEMQNAIAHNLLISVDSLSQLDLYGRLNPGGRVMVRFNPGIGAGHSKKVITAGKETKFGVCPEDVREVQEILARHNLTLAGVTQHIGSLFMQPDGYVSAAGFLLDFVKHLPAALREHLEIIDFGGGFGIPYHKYDNEARLDLAELGARLDDLFAAFIAETGYQGRFLVEPGRYVVAECSLLLGSVEAVKNNGPRRYVGTNLGFNVLVRPAMYDSFHDVEIYGRGSAADRQEMVQTLVGNICESGDILAKDRTWPEITEGDIVGVLDAGAYGFSMSSNYNTRLLPAEVLIPLEGKPRLIRRRQTMDDITATLV